MTREVFVLQDLKTARASPPNRDKVGQLNKGSRLVIPHVSVAETTGLVFLFLVERSNILGTKV